MRSQSPWPGGAPDCAFAQTVLDDDLDPVDATMIVTFREVLSNIRYFGIQPQDSVVVFGCGPVGLTYLKFMSLLGVKDLVAWRHPARKTGAGQELRCYSPH